MTPKQLIAKTKGPPEGQGNAPEGGKKKKKDVLGPRGVAGGSEPVTRNPLRVSLQQRRHKLLGLKRGKELGSVQGKDVNHLVGQGRPVARDLREKNRLKARSRKSRGN